MVQKIQKRDGRKVIFNPEKIYNPNFKAAEARQEHDKDINQKVFIDKLELKQEVTIDKKEKKNSSSK